MVELSGLDHKAQVIALIAEHTSIDKESIVIETPDSKIADYAFPCFLVSKKKGGNPAQIAKDLVEKISKDIRVEQAGNKHALIKEVKQAGPYVNFFMDSPALAKLILSRVYQEADSYGRSNIKEKVMIEYLSPNTNKPLHLGHIRNLAIGNSLSRTYRFLVGTAGKVTEANLVNDRGIHICKSMIAYKKWGHGITPESSSKKSDHLVGDFYVLYSNKVKEHPELEQEAHALLKKWEENDPEVITLWKMMNHWVYEGFEKTLFELGIKFDIVYFESQLYKNGRNIVEDGLKKGIFKKDDTGAVIAELSKEDKSIPDKVLIRSDGTTIYITQDIYLAVEKFKEYSLDKNLYVVGSEQILHFRQLFKILEILGYSWARKCTHVSYGMVNLPDGRMKSREGTVVDADDIIAELKTMAREEIIKRHPDLDEKEIEARAKIISVGALKFHMLLFDPVRDIVYDPEESISFEGETGPYVQYGHARCFSILEKYQEKFGERPKFNPYTTKFDLLTDEKEALVVKQLAKFPDIILDAAEHFRPSSIAKYLVETTQRFNEFYQKCIVISDDPNNRELTEARIMLVECVRIVLRKGLELLGITAPEKM